MTDRPYSLIVDSRDRLEVMPGDWSGMTDDGMGRRIRCVSVHATDADATAAKRAALQRRSDEASECD